MIVRDEAATLGESLPTLLPLIDSWTIVDTGSTDGTPEVVTETLRDVPGHLHHAEWTNFGEARTTALRLARGKADWTLMVDAEWYADVHPDLKTWLAGDPDPRVDAWMVEIEQAGMVWRRPLLTRGNQEWTYHGVVHECLDPAGRSHRALNGLVMHHRPSKKDEGKFNRYVELLKPEADLGLPRATFYLAESYRFAGRTQEAVEAYRRRAGMDEGFVEERWYSAYQAARLEDDVAGLLEAWRLRPWRHEPLTAAARIVAGRGAQGDLLFLEQPPR